MSKRKFSTNYALAKRQCEVPSSYVGKSANCDILALLEKLRNSFKLHSDIPPIVLIHQVYSLFPCRTTIDQKINNLQADGTIRLFKLNIDECSLAIVQTSDLVDYLNKKYPNVLSVKKFINVIIPKVKDVSIEKSLLRENFRFSNQDVSNLVNAGLLTVRCAYSYWFSVPSIADFITVFLKGRKYILRVIKKSKYSEMLLPELEKRNMEKSVTLSIQYHIHDIIGADLVQCIDSTSGTILRFVKMPSSTTKKKK